LQNPRNTGHDIVDLIIRQQVPNAGMICDKRREGSPCTIAAFQLPFGSGVVPAQSVKSGNVSGLTNTVLLSGAPLPVLPWHAMQPAL